jgi:hypothetical protein
MATYGSETASRVIDEEMAGRLETLRDPTSGKFVAVRYNPDQSSCLARQRKHNPATHAISTLLVAGVLGSAV